MRNTNTNPNPDNFNKANSGHSSPEFPYSQTNTFIVKESNGIGTAGFVMSLISLFFGWVPFLGWILWMLGLCFSIAGMFRNPKGLAIAGLVISLIGIILLIFVFGALFVAASMQG